MKAFIAFLGLFLSTANADTQAVCLSRLQAKAFVDQGSAQSFRYENLATGELKLERLRQPLQFWVFRPSNQVLSAEQVQAQCHARFAELQSGRMVGLLEALRQENPLALLFYYSMASAGTADQVCGHLKASRRYHLVMNGSDTKAFGPELLVSEDTDQPQMMETQRGLVFRPEACSFYRAK